MLHEWGLGGRRFGTLVTWFLIGGDLYTAYTFIAVPALLYGAGAIGFFAVPYTVMIYPFLYIVFPRLWSVGAQARLRDVGRLRARPLRQSLAGAGGGIHRHPRHHAVYRAAARRHAGGHRRDGDRDSGLCGDLPLIIAFVILAAFTYSSGLRAPAMIAVVKDTADLHHRVRRHHRRPHSSGRLRTGVRGDPESRNCCSPRRRPGRWAASAPMPHWHWARPARCSFTRTRSPES